MPGRTDSRGRLVVLVAVFAIVAAALIGRLAWWQLVRRDDLAAQAFRQTSVRSEVPSRRGAIYDRTGVVVLATTVERDRLVAAPDRLTATGRKAVVRELTAILRLDEAAATALDEKLRADRPYVILARGLDPAVSEQIRQSIVAGRLANVSLEPEQVRSYPQRGGGPDSSLAAHLLGFVNREGIGQYGVEQFYQRQLAGQPRIAYAQKDSRGRPVPETEMVDQPGVPGTDLRLTIDAGLQLAVEQEVLAAWVADRAASVSAVVIDPWTGEIYASASYPSYDANDYAAIAAGDPARFVDPIVSHVYEPGSVFKMLTVIAGLEHRTVGPDTRVRDVPKLVLDGGRTHIDNADHKGKGWISFADAIAYSRNVVAAKVALGLGATTSEAATDLVAVWRRLGFGAPTGIDVAGEVPGIVRDPALTTWRQIDLANASFGQGVAVTPIQLATAYSAMVNGGRLIRPYVVKAVGEEEAAARPAADAMEPSLSPTLISMMRHVVHEVPFYRDRTLIPGYDVGGKTGTAQIWDAETGGWKRLLYNYSFVGYIGREVGRPDLVVAIRINEARPTVANIGRLEIPVMSFELFRRIAHNAIATPGLLSERPVLPFDQPTPDEPASVAAADRAGSDADVDPEAASVSDTQGVGDQ
ncbi:MAG TPA: penicillin-binding protein 2 [Candidatus Limnocylindrales bacterium]|jgi:cell division protein FtsI (penicillin-binding protein 3)